MSETTELLESPRAGKPARGTGLSSMVLPELKAMASTLGIKGISGMRKGDLVAAISDRQGSARPADRASGAAQDTPKKAKDVRRQDPPPGADQQRNGHAEPAVQHAEPVVHQDSAPQRESAPQTAEPVLQPGGAAAPQGEAQPDDTSADAGNNGADLAQLTLPVGGRPQQSTDGQPSGESSGGAGNAGEEYPSRDRSRRNRRNRRDRVGADSANNGGANGEVQEAGDRQPAARTQPNTTQPNSANQNGSQSNGSQSAGYQNRDNQSRENPNRENQNRDSQNSNQNRAAQNRDQNRDQNSDDDLDGDGSRRGRRYRDRNRRGRERFTESPTDIEVRDDDVLLPVAGILDVLDSYAFVRTSGYLTGSNDVYVSLSQVRKYGLRRGDAVTGAVRAPRGDEAARQKFNALVRLDSINGLDPDQARNRPEFTKLTPLYPNERLRLETEPHIITTRVIDLVMPVGKGQRALIVSPPKAGKTSVLQAIANAIATNNPEVHLMVVLVDERPEEVTDMQRSVKGEVIASTFDRPPADHTQLAELAIERAKRLVEMGRDVVVLLDSITRLGRAYNLAAPASGRILSGGVDSTALFPPKRFLGAARNIENGGSLTIFASALVETGSAGDTVIFEEFKGTGNAELKLDRRIADKRVFPAIDIDQSSTRKEDLLMSPDEHAVVLKLRRVLAALDSQQALDLVLDRLRKTRSNVEFLMQVAATTPNADRD